MCQIFLLKVFVGNCKHFEERNSMRAGAESYSQATPIGLYVTNLMREQDISTAANQQIFIIEKFTNTTIYFMQTLATVQADPTSLHCFTAHILPHVCIYVCIYMYIYYVFTASARLGHVALHCWAAHFHSETESPPARSIRRCAERFYLRINQPEKNKTYPKIYV